jgi:hypothetical protein
MAILGRLCPNYDYHFKVANGCPTDTKDKHYVAEFQHLPLISYHARQYDPVEIDLYQTDESVPPLTTRGEQTSARHKSSTTRCSYPKPKGTDTNTKSLTSDSVLLQRLTPTSIT